MLPDDVIPKEFVFSEMDYDPSSGNLHLFFHTKDFVRVVVIDVETEALVDSFTLSYRHLALMNARPWPYDSSFGRRILCEDNGNICQIIDHSARDYKSLISNLKFRDSNGLPRKGTSWIHVFGSEWTVKLSKGNLVKLIGTEGQERNVLIDTFNLHYRPYRSNK